jgi:hypothetical protein
MPSPFPGMNPYLERPDLWPGLHLLLIANLSDLLAPQLSPKYIVAVEVRMYETSDENSILVGIPDVAIGRSQSPKETSLNVTVAEAVAQPIVVTLPITQTVRQGYLEIRQVGTNEVVTTIEILSPTNKRSGQGRRDYESKRQKVLGSSTHLVEIDLLRYGEPMPFFRQGLESDYRILVSRSERRPQADLYPFNLQNLIPPFPLPLQAGDVEPVIDLKALLDVIYERSAYQLRIDYSQEPVPPLSKADADWNDRWLQQQRLR